MDARLYEDLIYCEYSSMIAGKSAEEVTSASLRGIPVLAAWLDDDDLQQIQVVSTNIGFVRTYRKRFRKEAKS